MGQAHPCDEPDAVMDAVMDGDGRDGRGDGRDGRDGRGDGRDGRGDGR